MFLHPPPPKKKICDRQRNKASFFIDVIPFFKADLSPKISIIINSDINFYEYLINSDCRIFLA